MPKQPIDLVKITYRSTNKKRRSFQKKCWDETLTQDFVLNHLMEDFTNGKIKISAQWNRRNK